MYFMRCINIYLNKTTEVRKALPFNSFNYKNWYGKYWCMKILFLDFKKGTPDSTNRPLLIAVLFIQRAVTVLKKGGSESCSLFLFAYLQSPILWMGRCSQRFFTLGIASFFNYIPAEDTVPRNPAILCSMAAKHLLCWPEL